MTITDQTGTAGHDLTTTTVVQLLYRRRPGLDFDGLADDLARVVGGPAGSATRMGGAGSQIVHVDHAAGRLSIGLHHRLGAPYDSCLTLAVGSGKATADGGTWDRQTLLARQLSRAVTDRLPADRVLWHVTPAPNTTRLVTDLLSQIPGNLSGPGSGPGFGPDDDGDPADLPRILRQVEDALAARRPFRPEPQVPRRTMLGAVFGPWGGARALIGGPSAGSGPSAAAYAHTADPAPEPILPMLPEPANSVPDLPRLATRRAQRPARVTLRCEWPRHSLVIRLAHPAGPRPIPAPSPRG